MMAIAGGGHTVNLPIKMVQTKNTLVQVLNILRCASTVELRFNITNVLTEDKTLNLMKSIYVLYYSIMYAIKASSCVCVININRLCIVNGL